MALEQFAERGFANTTIRSVATAAQVDPSLVVHFFGNKDGLFSASVGNVLAGPRSQLREALAPGLPGLGRRLASTYLGLWEDPTTALHLSAIYRSASSNRHASKMVQLQLIDVITPELSAGLPANFVARFPIVMGQLLGIALTRYLFGATGDERLSLEDLIDVIGPALDRTLQPEPSPEVHSPKLGDC